MVRAFVLMSVLLSAAGSGSARPPVPKVAADQKKSRPVPLAFPQMLLDDEVRDELDVTAEQVRDIEGRLKKYCADEDAKLTARLAKGNPGGGGGVPAPISVDDIDADEMRDMIQTAGGREKVLKPVLEGTLTPAQVERLGQIDLQLQGPAALLHRRSVRALKLTEEQENRIEDVEKEFTSALKDWWDALADDEAPTEDEWEKAVKVLNRSAEKVQEALTPEQRQTWKDRTGKPAPLADLLPAAYQRSAAFFVTGGIFPTLP